MLQQTIDRYQIKEELGRGGMGAVYRAYDPLFGRDVAIKILPQEFLQDPTPRARFEREARIIAALEHPAIVPVYDFGEQARQPFLVMRYMAGGSLAARLVCGPLSLAESTRILQRLAPALDMAHQRGVVHRDLKPANILFDEQDNPHIADFGIAKIAEATISLTASGVIGTPAYMSPEQAQGDVELDGRSDIYAMGAMLFEMLTGRQPYQATTPVSVAMKHVLDPVPRVCEVAPHLPIAVDHVIQRAMAKKRGDRFPTTGALTSALTAASVGQPGKSYLDTPAPLSPAPKVGMPTSRNRPPQPQPWWRAWPVWLAAGLLVAIISLMAAGIGGINRNVVSSATYTAPAIAAARPTSAEQNSTTTPPLTVTSTPASALGSTDTLTVSPTPMPRSTPRSTDTQEPTTTSMLPPTSMPVPTETPALPTNTPVPQLRFQPVSIRQVANASTQEGYGSPPLGTVELGGVTFNLPTGANSVTTQAEPLPNNPLRIELSVDLSGPRHVYLLITGGNVFSRFAGQQIGLVRLHFSDGPSLSVPLIAGQNIREWKLLDNQTVSTITSPSVREVWRTESNHGGLGIIDLLTIDLGNTYLSDRLVGIDVIDTSADTVNSTDPAINLIGAAVLAFASQGF